ncbi:MAG: serpin family protein [Candidatus Izemoplasmatales bacterium]
MMKKILIVFLFTFFIFSAPVVEYVVADDLTVSTAFYDGYINFAYDSFDELDHSNNLVYSPTSLFYVLMMLYSFSGNELETDFENYFGFSKEDMLLEIEHFTSDIQIETEQGSFWFQNFLYYDNNPYYYNVSVLEENQPSFNYQLAEYDFSSGEAGEELARRITEGTDHFLELSENDFLDLLSANILFDNTIYYQGIWEELFKEENNIESTFFGLNDEETTVTYMVKDSSSATYIETELAKVGRFYMNDGSSIAFVLPAEDKVLNDVLEDTYFIKSLLVDQNQYDHRSIHLTLPKFSAESSLKFEDMLNTIGLGRIYEIGNQYPSLTLESDFQISLIKQVSKIELDEEGVKVASTTISIGCAASAPPLEFFVNQPFVFIIYSPNDIPLFMGHIYSII